MNQQHNLTTLVVTRHQAVGAARRIMQLIRANAPRQATTCNSHAQLHEQTRNRTALPTPRGRGGERGETPEEGRGAKTIPLAKNTNATNSLATKTTSTATAATTATTTATTTTATTNHQRESLQPAGAKEPNNSHFKGRTYGGDPKGSTRTREPAAGGEGTTHRRQHCLSGTIAARNLFNDSLLL